MIVERLEHEPIYTLFDSGGDSTALDSASYRLQNVGEMLQRGLLSGLPEAAREDNVKIQVFYRGKLFFVSLSENVRSEIGLHQMKLCRRA